jgi:RimJ/RimL family protein N-acetyltransferase
VPVLDTPTLSGRHVTLEPMRIDLAAEIAAAASGDRSSFGHTQVPDGPAAALAYVEWLLDDQAAGRVAPLVQRRTSDGAVVGCTRFMSPYWTLGRADPDEIEVGGTWLSAAAQRTGINTEAKLLLLTHAFDHWQVQRVAICTDSRNEQSRRAVERLGATFEGVLRRHRQSTRANDVGVLRDTATYSVTIDDWPDVRERLRHLTARADPA